jgi:antitoxin Phd
MNINVTELENRVGQYIQQAVVMEPIVIEETGCPMAVMMSYTDYERLKKIEDAFWALKAIEAEKSGYVGENSLSELMRIKTLKDSDGD